MAQQPVNRYYPPTVDPRDRAVWDRINFLLGQVASLNERMAGLGAGRQAQAISQLQVQIAAVQDALTQAGTFVGAGSSQFSPPSVTIAASGDGFTISGPSDAGTVSVTDATVARAALDAAQRQSPGAHTIMLAPITGGGMAGSITWSADGVVSGFVDPT